MSAAKKADLLSLVASGTIPKEFEAYYQSLPSSKTVKDKLPCPSVSDSDKSDEIMKLCIITKGWPIVKKA